MLEKLKEGGLGEQAASWVSKGQNLPISADQIQNVLGSEMVSSMAARFGISKEEISAKLAEYLPATVDQMTPDGEVPAGA